MPIDHGGELASDRRSGDGSAVESEIRSRAILDRPDGDPDRCTIYSTSHSDSLITTWISAEEGSYRSLEEIR